MAGQDKRIISTVIFYRHKWQKQACASLKTSKHIHVKKTGCKNPTKYHILCSFSCMFQTKTLLLHRNDKKQ